MSTPPKPVITVQNLLNGAPGKRVLLVEGPNDKDVYSAWLKKLAHPDLFSAKVIVEQVGNKQQVLTALEWFRDNGNPLRLFGLVDRDEWDAGTLLVRTTALPQLRVAANSDALESYFSDPDELEPSLRVEDPAFAGQFPAFRAHLNSALPDWVRHWALFTTTERVKERMNAAIYPGAFHATIPIPADADIQNRFQDWSNLVAHPRLFQEFDALRTAALASGLPEQFQSHVSSKRFFEYVVHAGPGGLQQFSAKADRTWRLDLAENTPVIPADIAAILRPLLV